MLRRGDDGGEPVCVGHWGCVGDGVDDGGGGGGGGEWWWWWWVG